MRLEIPGAALEPRRCTRRIAFGGIGPPASLAGVRQGGRSPLAFDLHRWLPRTVVAAESISRVVVPKQLRFLPGTVEGWGSAGAAAPRPDAVPAAKRAALTDAPASATPWSHSRKSGTAVSAPRRWAIVLRSGSSWRPHFRHHTNNRTLTAAGSAKGLSAAAVFHRWRLIGFRRGESSGSGFDGSASPKSPFRGGYSGRLPSRRGPSSRPAARGRSRPAVGGMRYLIYQRIQ